MSILSSDNVIGLKVKEFYAEVDYPKHTCKIGYKVYNRVSDKLLGVIIAEPLASYDEAYKFDSSSKPTCTFHGYDGDSISFKTSKGGIESFFENAEFIMVGLKDGKKDTFFKNFFNGDSAKSIRHQAMKDMVMRAALNFFSDFNGELGDIVYSRELKRRMEDARGAIKNKVHDTHDMPDAFKKP